jgi:hypothetical protein
MLRLASLANLAAISPSIAEWRWAIFSIGIGAIFLAIGLFAAGIFLWRKQTTDRTLLYFGVFVILYALRVFLREPVLLSVFAISFAVADHIIRAITFTIALPTLFLFLDVVQTRWRRVILWMLGVQSAFAVLAILCDLFGIARRAVDISNSFSSWPPGVFWSSFYLFSARPAGFRANFASSR